MMFCAHLLVSISRMLPIRVSSCRVNSVPPNLRRCLRFLLYEDSHLACSCSDLQKEVEPPQLEHDGGDHSDTTLKADHGT